jgi:hypothetical protein
MRAYYYNLSSLYFLRNSTSKRPVKFTKIPGLSLTPKDRVQPMDYKQIEKTLHQTIENSENENFHQVDDSIVEIFRFVSAYL